MMSLRPSRSAAQLRAVASILLLAALGYCEAQLQRVPNTSLAMPTSPPISGYTAANAFGSLTFVSPVAITSPPGETNRIFIVEKNGTIQVITNLAAPNKTLFMDISNRVTSTMANSGGNGEQGLLGMAFHPGYATNRYFFLFYTGPATTSVNTGGRHDILARFQTSALNPNQGDPASEVRLITQYDNDPNHDAGDIHFGPDGYLYVPLGDEGGGDDSNHNSQRIDKDFFSGILRIDVDQRPGSLNPNPHSSVVAPTNYAVPPDNPFIGVASFNGLPLSPELIRTEFWAVGLRNPWRIAFDSLTGELYCGDVGQANREEVNLIEKGRNYGWNYWEGFLQRTNPTPAAFTNRLPLVDYSHSAGRVCIIGGVVSHAPKLPQLNGAYLYAEYATGEIWSLRQTNGVLSQSNLLLNAGSSERITTFGTDPSNGDVLYAAHLTTGFATVAQIKRIRTNSIGGAPVPATLAAAGVFANLSNLTPYPGIVPYDINVPFWSDNAIKSRWFSVPNTNLTIGFNPNVNWSFPTGTVWIKHFELELTNGVPASRKRLETRLLVKNAAGAYGVTYRWGDSTTNATLVSSAGMDESFTINDGGILRTQVWHYPSWTECQACHTTEGGFGLGFNSPQLNHNFNYGSGLTNQIVALSRAGYFNTGVTNTSGLLALSHATNTTASLDFRARSYLAANCVHCHQPGGSAQQANWDARITTPTAQTGLIYGTLTDNFGNPNNRVITPLLLTNSILHTRIGMRGPQQMPPLATSIVDTQNVALIAQWIGSMSNTFWLGVTPLPAAVMAGNAVDISINVLPTSDFSNQVSLSVEEIPYGTHVAFNPTTIDVTGTSTLRLTTSPNTPGGNYLLPLTGVGGNASNTIPLILNVFPYSNSFSFEAEDLNFVTNGATAAVQFDASSSNGEWEALLADGVGDYIDYDIPSIPAGNYHLKMKYKAHPNRGILSMTLDGNLVTSALDQFASIPEYPEASFDNLALPTTGPHVIRQTVVGRFATAGTYTLSADRFTFEAASPPIPPPPVINQTVLTDGNLSVSGGMGLTNGVYYVLSSTDVSAPRSEWTIVATNLFNASGNFAFSIPIQTGAAQQFYVLQLP